MERSRKLELLDAQIALANDGDPADFNLWRETTGVVLRNVLGDTNPIYDNFGRVRYTLSIYAVSTPESQHAAARRRGVRAAIALLEAAKLEVEIGGGTPEVIGPVATGTTVFIVHGHDDAHKHELARFVRAATGFEPVILHEQPDGGRTVIEKFEDHAADAAYAIVLATADDYGRSALEDGLQPRARQNVIFEWGFFYGALGRARVGLLYDPAVERPSDLAGVVTIALDAAGAWKMHLARELAAAGMGIDWSSLA